MASIARNPPPLLRAGDRLTRDEFMRRWEAMPELKRAELIDGVVYMPSPVSKFHSRGHSVLTIWLGQYELGTIGCRVLTAGTWLMSGDSAPQPDLALCLDPGRGGQSASEGNYSAGAPELIVEVTNSTMTRDLGEKLRLYERSGVKEYVTVRPKRQQVIWRELYRRKYREIKPGPDGWFRSRVFPGLWLDPEALWADNTQALAAGVKTGLDQPEHAAFVRLLASRRKR